MRKINLIIVIFFLLVFGCNDSEHSTNGVKEDVTNDSFKVINKKIQIDSFYLSQDTLKESTEILVNLPDNHPKKVAIISESGEYYYLQDEPEINYLGSETSFDSIHEFILKQDQKGIVFRDGKKVETAIFLKQGLFRLIVADNLETEPENTNYLEEKIYFIK